MKYRSKYEGPWADIYVLPQINVAEWRYQRPVIKMEKCCQCGICYFLCPTECISNQGHYFIPDLAYCKGCGICASVCPVNAINMVRETKQ